jgi:FtsP/CotA-like multicopper oxidase with cupredoxin domain
MDDLPPGSERAVDLAVSETPLEVADKTFVAAWTYNGSAPGPVLRAKAGDRLKVRLRNATAHAHSVHFHGRHLPTEDGWQPVPAGAEETYTVSAEPFGLHPYHCHTLPLGEHMARGLYGALIVDPPGGRRPAHEFVLVLSGWDADGDGRNALYAWNGVASFHRRFPIRVPAGELVRLYLVNMVEQEPLASFHLHAQTFDVFPSGTCLEPTAHTDVISLAQTERAIVEFRLPSRGRYMFHPHQSAPAARSAPPP